jgi:protoheme IX farnesyltransferase
MGWTAATNSIDIGGLLLFSVMMIWQIPHFLAIAIYRREEYAKAGLVMLPEVRGLEFTRAQMLFYTFILLPIPLLLFISNTTSWTTLILGTILSFYWFSQAIDGYRNKREDKWARKFFGTSLIYLLGMFGAILIDGLLMMWGMV